MILKVGLFSWQSPSQSQKFSETHLVMVVFMTFKAPQGFGDTLLESNTNGRLEQSYNRILHSINQYVCAFISSPVFRRAIILSP